LDPGFPSIEAQFFVFSQTVTRQQHQIIPIYTTSQIAIMSFGKLYGFAGNPRTDCLRVIAQMNNLDIELVETNPSKGTYPQDYTSKTNRLGKIPTFVGADGFVLSEVLAIAVYCKSGHVLAFSPVISHFHSPISQKG